MMNCGGPRPPRPSACGTSSPPRSASFSVTCSSVRCFGSSVVSHSSSGSISPSPLKRVTVIPFSPSRRISATSFRRCGRSLRALAVRPARTAPAARGRPRAAAAPGRAGSKPGVAQLRHRAVQRRGPRATRPACTRSAVSSALRRPPSGLGGARSADAPRRPSTSSLPSFCDFSARNASTSAWRVEPVLLAAEPDVVDRELEQLLPVLSASLRRGTSSSVCPRRSRFTTAVSTSASTGQELARARRRSRSRSGGSGLADVQHRVLQPAARSARFTISSRVCTNRVSFFCVTLNSGGRAT